MAKKKASVKTAAAAKPARGIESLSPAARDSRGYQEIAETKLERFPNRNRRRAYTVEFTCPEFTCVCPKTGFPDFATIFIRYQPDEWCVELKSLKLYINKFRDMGVYHEDVTNVIADDLIDLLDPNQIEIVADFTVRGNIHTVVTVNHSKSSTKIDD
jgi:7-cyano-7-deazaguanine reductase